MSYGEYCLSHLSPVYFFVVAQVNTSEPDEIVTIFTDFKSDRQMEDKTYTVLCCSGIAIDLLNAVSRDLNFGYDLYLVGDGLFGVPRNGNWDGITADLMSGAAHLAFSAFSVTSSRVEVSFLNERKMCFSIERTTKRSIYCTVYECESACER